MDSMKRVARRTWLAAAGAAAGLLVLATVAGAFSIPVHIDVTSELEMMTAEVQGRTVMFSERAIEQIDDANEGVDSVLTRSAALYHPERHFTNEEFRAGTQRLLDLRDEILRLVRQARPDGRTARTRLGQALHTVQDFYSHGTWVELGRTNINNSFGRNTDANPAAAVMPCPNNPNTVAAGAGGAPSSAYFVGGLFASGPIGCNPNELPAGKCFHGNYTAACIGINKDLTMAEAMAEGVPFNPLHPAAVTVARAATRDYVQQILDELEGEDKALQALLDVNGSFGFVIDDTGSMGPEIAGVRNVVTRIVNTVSNTPTIKPTDYILVRFGDPTIGSAFTTTDPSALLAAVNGIFPGGGGDCPELSQGGLLAAVDAALDRSYVYLFTDASSKDASRANLVISRAQDKEIQVIYALTGSCSPIDPSYLRVAEETGGQVFLLPSGQVPLLFDLIEPQLAGDQTLMARHKGDFGLGDSELIALPVDSTVGVLQVAVSVDVKDDVVLRRPDGTAVADGDTGVEITELASGCIVTVDGPEPGGWELEVAGSGEFTAAARVNSPVQLGRFDFVEPNGPEDVHGGFFPIPGQPVAGDEGLGEATLYGAVASAQFALQDELGQVFDLVDLAQGYPFASPRHYLGSFDLPSIPFRVVVTGLDEEGYAYQRLYPVIYRAQTVGVEVDGLRVLDVAPGETVEITYVVTNLGSTATFTAAAADDLGFVAGVSPSVVSLASGESAEIVVTATVPAGAAGGEISTVTLTVTKSGDDGVFNSASTVINVVDNLAPDCSAAAAVDLELWPPDHRMESIDPAAVAGVVDPDGDPLSFEVVGITQDEPVDGTGAGDTAPDGAGIGDAVAQVRVERSGSGNGRVYQVSFQATDDQGASCDGTLRVSVPKSQGSGAAVDDGQLHDSTGG